MARTYKYSNNDDVCANGDHDDRSNEQLRIILKLSTNESLGHGAGPHELRFQRRRLRLTRPRALRFRFRAY